MKNWIHGPYQSAENVEHYVGSDTNYSLRPMNSFSELGTAREDGELWNKWNRLKHRTIEIV